eukprot:854280-Rhodomonas_salina.1
MDTTTTTCRTTCGGGGTSGCGPSSLTGQRQSRPFGLGLLPGVFKVAGGCTSLGNNLVRCGTQH